MDPVYDEHTWLKHLREDIMPYWLRPAMLGAPRGNFPTYADQNGCPVPGELHYMRMQGRQIYVYLAGAELLGDPRLLEIGEAGLAWLEEHAVNPRGGFRPLLTPEGEAVTSADVTVQDLCYTVFPYLTLYRVRGRLGDLRHVTDLARLIAAGPFWRNGTLVNALNGDYSEERTFEEGPLNIVSVIDFMNLILIPLAGLGKTAENLFPELPEVLLRMTELLVGQFWSGGIFWNTPLNRSDYGAKHVDLGHTSKAYRILFEANRLLAARGLPVRYKELEQYYPPLVKKAAAPGIGWLTDFSGPGELYCRDSLQWWRHILIDQTCLRYVAEYPEIEPALRNGLECWLRLPFADRERPARGIREGLRPDGSLWGNDDSQTCKANLWKNGYHEVEHAASVLEYIRTVR